jgi:hypothetical protein
MSITLYASNRKELRSAPSVGRYLVPEQGMNIKLVDFQPVPCDTSEILTRHLSSVISDYLLNKVPEFYADKCSTDFECINREWKNIVYS